MSKLGFFNNNEKEIIEFEVDEKRYADFTLALSLLNLSKEQAFEEFLSLMITKALKKANGENDSEPVNEEPSKHLSPATIRNRIYKWARNTNSFPHLMVKAYLNTSLNMQEDFAYRAKMQAHFENSTQNFDGGRRFISLFRQMCSDSSRAYGNIFIYDSARENVYLNEAYKDLIIELQDQFLY